MPSFFLSNIQSLSILPVYNTSKIVYKLSEPSPVHSPVQSRVQVLYHPVKKGFHVLHITLLKYHDEK